jgi:flagellar biosynthesis/type III secretory pathway M-ring protein FliF/YscJ
MAGRRRRKRRARGLFLLLVLALLIAGFMTRRLMLPRMFPRLGNRSAATPAAAQTQSASNEPAASHNGSGEHLTNKDRKALDDVIRQKTGEGR